jgi:hypothetical protein
MNFSKFAVLSGACRTFADTGNAPSALERLLVSANERATVTERRSSANAYA